MVQDERFAKIIELIQRGKVKEVDALVIEGISLGVGAMDLLNKGLLAAMDEVATKWKAGKVFIPEVLIAARCLNSALVILEPELVKAKIESKGTVVIGTVKGDLHDIGKNLVALMLKSKGFKVVDIGTDAPAQKFVDAIIGNEAQFVCMSSLLTTSMPNFKDVIAAIETAGLREKVCVAVGGAPVTQAYADEVGADVFTIDAVTCAESLLQRVS
jgi:5-methyltetrahydrofolate--homocysteine methyltransferase